MTVKPKTEVEQLLPTILDGTNQLYSAASRGEGASFAAPIAGKVEAAAKRLAEIASGYSAKDASSP